MRLPKDKAEGFTVDLPKEMHAFIEGSTLPALARVDKVLLKEKALETEIRFVLFYRQGKELREALSQPWKLRLKWSEPALPDEVKAAAGRIFAPASSDPSTWENYWPPEPPAPPGAAAGPRPSREVAPGIFTIGSDMEWPECISCPDPGFPRQARDFSSGLVILFTVVNEKGRAQGVYIKKADPPGAGFEDAAVWAVSGWKFKPAFKDGKPVSVLMTIEVNFRRF